MARKLSESVADCPIRLHVGGGHGSRAPDWGPRGPILTRCPCPKVAFRSTCQMRWFPPASERLRGVLVGVGCAVHVDDEVSAGQEPEPATDELAMGTSAFFCSQRRWYR